MKFKIINSLLFLTIVIASCSKKLDTTPTQQISVSDALSTSSNVQVALVGSYSALGAVDFYGGRAFVGPDLLGNSDDLTWNGTYQGFTQISNKAITIDNGFVANTWLTGYTAINDVNNVLSALNVVLASSKDRVQGEAEFIRGSVYFDLVRLYAKDYNNGDPTANAGVPIVLTPTASITNDSKVKRSTVAQVYAQVITDLTDAANKLPASNGFYANKYAASAMLARVYLQMGDYTNAAAAANTVISSGKYSLTDNYADAFPAMSPPAPVANTTEDIFAMQVTASSGTNGFQEFYSAAGRGEITIKPTHLSKYEGGDDRLNLFYTSGGSTFTGKFENLYGNTRIIRLAEMYLTRAEANFRLGTSVGASPVADINVIRARVLLTPLTSLNLTLARIIKERKLELAFEGFALWDAKRLKIDVGVLPYTSSKLVYPIPKREIIVNANLTQNEGYF